MFDARSLKQSRPSGPDSVECPVLACHHQVERQTKQFVREERFRCEGHRIYISASTFEYEDYLDNVLSGDPEDRNLLQHVFKVKREQRFARERSEDALTFNVLRTLEREGVLHDVAPAMSGYHEQNATISYWSLSAQTGELHAGLADARKTFGEEDGRGTEPDVIIETDSTLLVIEAKLDSAHETKPSKTEVLRTYASAAGGWYGKVFRSSADEVARKQKLYQLMRLWLLGTWMADRAGKRFVLVSLTPEACEKGISARFGVHIVASEKQQFVRHTWEQIREQVQPAAHRCGIARLVEYLDNKSCGYDGNGRLRLAFARSPRCLPG